MRQDKEWKLEGVLAELANIDKKMADRSFAFILGAGASISSGIPSGADLARRWLKDLHCRECLDDALLDAWLMSNPLDIDGLSVGNAAEFYPEIFERRFGFDQESGYAELEDAMKCGKPSPGYSLLAEIMQNTRHKVVVTTNFDNLIVDALAMHEHQSPLVVGHEMLAGFARPKMRRPLIAKIHRDLFLAPQNNPTGVSQMSEGWKSALKRLFQHYTPLIIGYGGNDGSLMGLLESLDAGEIAGRLVWCYRDAPPAQRAQAVLDKHDGKRLKIAGFDEFMVSLATTLIDGFDVSKIAGKLTASGNKRAEDFQNQTDKLLNLLKQGGPSQQQAGAVLAQSARNDDSWWAWQVRADAEGDVQKRRTIYEDGIKHLPGSAELHHSYAMFLQCIAKDMDGAEAMFRRATELAPTDAGILGNFASFLSRNRADLNQAEGMFKKALDIDPAHANNMQNYATFLNTRLQNSELASELFQKSLALDPSNAAAAANYAMLLSNQDKLDAAEGMLRQSISSSPSNATGYVMYAAFLANRRKKFEDAAKIYKQAIAIEPQDHNVYANLTECLLICADENNLEEAKTFGERAQQLVQKPDQGQAEALLYLCIIAELQHTNVSSPMSCLKSLLQRGFQRAEWDFKPVFDAVFPKISADRRSIFSAMGAAILDESKVSHLQDFPEWSSLGPGDELTSADGQQP